MIKCLTAVSLSGKVKKKEFNSGESKKPCGQYIGLYVFFLIKAE